MMQFTMFNKKTAWLAIAVLFLAACSTQSVVSSGESAHSARNTVHAAEKLGTKWGDEIQSEVRTVDLRRADSRPIDERVLRYAAKPFDGRKLNALSLADGKIEFSLRDDGGKVLPMFRDAGNYYVQGKEGQSYSLVYRNTSANTYEIVASVDGLDVLDGSAASRYNRGYVLNPHSTLTVEGFRKSSKAVASFTFSAPSGAYAANSANGSISNVGVIGTVVFELYDPKARRQNSVQPNAFPADKTGYAPAPR